MFGWRHGVFKPYQTHNGHPDGWPLYSRLMETRLNARSSN